MVQPINFYAGGIGGAAEPIRAAYISDPRVEITNALLQQGTDTSPVHGWGEGVVRALAAALGGWQRGRVNREYQDRAKAYNDTVAGAVEKGGDFGQVAQALAANPDTAQLGLELRLKQMDSQAQNAGKQVRTLTPAEAQQMGLDPTGVYQVDGYGNIKRAQDPEKPPFEGAIRGPDGRWVVDPNFLQARQQIAAAGRAPAAPRAQWVDVKDQQGNVIGQRDVTSGKFDAAPGYAGAGGLNKDAASVEGKIRDDFGQATKDFAPVQTGYQKVLAASKNPSATSDVALIFGFMKILDPTSVVREGEYATAQQAAGVPDQIVNLYNRIVSGERLNDQQRKEFTATARQQYEVQRTIYRRTKDAYRGIAKRSSVNPDNAVVDMELPDDQAPAGPQPGAGGPNLDTPSMGAPGAQPSPAASQAPAAPGSADGIPAFSDPNDPKLKAMPSGSVFWAVKPDGTRTMKFVP